MNFRFENSDYLMALTAIPLLVIFYLWAQDRKKRIREKMGDRRLVDALLAGYSSQRAVMKFALLLLALALMAGGIANLRQPAASGQVNRKGVDVVIALDVSRSMLAEDIKPNRLERARDLIYKLMDELGNDRIGLVLFAGRAYLQMPLTSDYAAARLFVQTASPDMVPTQGTVIAEALRMGQAAFENREAKYKSILLITDGEDHDPEALKLAKEMADNGVSINTVGIGSAEGSRIPDPSTGSFKTDANGQVVVSRLNEQELKQLATDTKGVYVHYDNSPDAVKEIIGQLSTIQQTRIEDSAFREYQNYFQWFLAAAFLLLLTEIFLPERKKIKS